MRYLSVILALVLLASCGNETEQPPVRVVNDPQRIISLAPFVTEILFALGVGDRMVGATTYCDYPEAARAIPRVGDMNANYERIVGQKPDLVIATEGEYVVDTLAMLREAGINAVAVPSHGSLEGQASILEIGRWVNRLEEAQKLVDRIDDAFRHTVARTASLPKTRVLVVGWDNANMTAMGKGTTIDALINAAGGQNVVTDSGSRGYVINFSIERAITLAPEVIIISDWEAITPDRIRLARERWQAYRSIPAVQSNRIHIVFANIIDRIGPRLPEGLTRMTEILHPELSSANSVSVP